MVIVMKQDASDGDIDAVAERVRANGGEAFVSRGTVHTIIGLVGDTERFKAIDWRQMAGVDHVIQIGKPYKMVSRDLHPETTVVKIGTVPIGRDSFTIIAGPCAVENEEQTMTAVKAAKDAGATVMRGDVYKPRTSPYSFQGLGEEGIEILQEARRRFGLPFVVEVVDVSQVEHVADVADCIRIGTRNAQNFEPSTRNTLDLGGMAVAQQESHLPVMVDPSHAVGKHSLVAPMACAAIAAGADAVMVDIHPRPEDALVDGAQALVPDEVIALGKQLQAIAD